jgi:hypothetical protein
VQAFGFEPKFTCTMRWILIVIHVAWRLGIVMFLTQKKRRAETARRQEVENFGIELSISD